MSTVALDVIAEVGQAIRGDWGTIDGRSIRSTIDYLVAAAKEEAVGPAPDVKALRDRADVCLAGHGHWQMYCDDSCREG